MLENNLLSGSSCRCGDSNGAAWALADITMGGMALINIPVCIAIGGVVYKALDDYMKQKKAGLNPVFHARDIGMDPLELNFWGDE